MQESKDRDKSRKNQEAPDYKPYPREEDIYQTDREVPLDDEEPRSSRKGERSQEEADSEHFEDFPEDLRESISTPEDDDWNTENFDTDHSGDDLDVPGAELDDEQEDIGEEDEENNYYSLGGPRKDD